MFSMMDYLKASRANVEAQQATLFPPTAPTPTLSGTLAIMKFPQPLQLEILKHSDHYELLLLSLLSRKATELVSVANGKTPPSDGTRISVGRDMHGLRIFFEPEEDRHNRSVISVDDNGRLVEYTNPRKLSGYCIYLKASSHVRPDLFDFKGYKMEIDLSKNPTQIDVFHNTAEDFFPLQKLLITHLLTLYVTRPRVELSLWPSDILTHPFWDFEKKLEKLSIDKPQADRELLSVEEMKFLMEEVEVTELLTISTPIEGRLESPNGFQAKKIDISHASWVNLDSVINWTSADIRLHECLRPTASQLNSLLKQWMTKEKLESLTDLTLKWQMEDGERLGDEYIEEVRLGTDLQESGVQEAGRLDGTIRRVDGLEASVTILNPWGSHFLFSLTPVFDA